MSQTFSAAQNSPAYDDSDPEYQALRSRFPFAPPRPEPALPAPAHAPSPAPNTVATTPEQRPSRPLDVSTILNPTPQRPYERSRRGSFGYLSSPRSRASRPVGQHDPVHSLPPSPVELSRPSETTFRGILSPRRSTPSLSAAAAQPRIRHQTRSSLSGIVTADEPQFPLGTPRRPGPYRPDSFPSPRSRLRAPQFSRPLPAPQLPQPHGFQFPPTSASSQYSPGYSISAPISPANPSPTSSYASHTPTAPPGPQGGPGHSAAAAAFGHPFQRGPGTPGPGPSYTLAGPTGTSAHGPFPMMALNTAHGTMQIPVDTTAASKIADEKRKRNAGASARFRQRRKEREREMSTRISELERRVKKTEDERDYFRNLLMQMRQGQGGRYPPLPPMSPRLPEVNMDSGSGRGSYSATESACMENSETESTRGSVSGSGAAEEPRGEASSREAHAHLSEQGRGSGGQQVYPPDIRGMQYQRE